ncbi:hypothetical protein NQ318_012155 [Aromia moschata]|uniref:LITAF domain-containing protein n=1 Tax=Aromia moschata TaxID=1265417 RepID=A0AAV8Z1U5_9CUCU|nr:hypothetical protein NQ318_012155 [Aromia moschata]
MVGPLHSFHVIVISYYYFVIGTEHWEVLVSKPLMALGQMEKQNPPPYSPPQPGFYPPPQGPPPPGHGYPPPPVHGYPPPPEQSTTHTVIVTHTAPLILGPQPTPVTCPSCHAQIVTEVQTEATTKTHLFALLLCLFGCYPCCCIPYCMDSCQGQNHYCPNCRAYLGKFEN